MEIHLSVINLYQCEKSFVTPKRVLACHYLLYVHEGTGRYKIGNTFLDAAAGDIFYCPPRMGNAILADAQHPFLLSGIEFSGAENLPLPRKSNLLHNPFLVSCIQQMVEEYRLGLTGSDTVCDHLLSVLLSGLVREGEQQYGDAAGKLLSYIVRHYAENITHEKLSELFSYHKNSINRILIKSTGMSLKNYLIDLRIKRASELLLYSSKPVREIAELCGYSSPDFFTRQFRQKTGFTPLRYRQQNIRRDSEKTC